MNRVKDQNMFYALLTPQIVDFIHPPNAVKIS